MNGLYDKYKLSGLVHSSFNLYFREMTEYWIHQSPNKIVSLKLHLLMYFIMDVKTFFFWVCIPVRKYILLDVLICRIKMCFPLWYAESYHDDFPTNHFVNTDMEKQKEWFSGYSHHLFVITYILWITFTFANLVDFVFETVPFGHFLPLVHVPPRKTVSALGLWRPVWEENTSQKITFNSSVTHSDYTILVLLGLLLRLWHHASSKFSWQYAITLRL